MKTKIISALLICIPFIVQAQNVREHILLDDSWQFAFGDASSPEKDFGCGTEYFNYLTKAASIHNEGPYSPKFDASGWGTVNLPHDWVVDLPYAKEASHSHGYKTVGYKYPGTSVGWYRKTFSIPEEDFGRHIWLQFDGIFRDSRIWVNGFYLGHEPSGYATQVYDISEYLNYGGENLICVRADATLEEGWFYEGAGIYRHVWLNKTSPVNVAPFGTFVYADFPAPYSLREGNAPRLDFASLAIETTVRNMGTETACYTLRHTLRDAGGIEAGSVRTEPACIAAKGSDASAARIPVENPHLWSCEDPYMYTVTTEVFVDGKLADTYVTPAGIRHIAFDKDRGFLLNGKQVKLKGVDMHQDNAGTGSGMPDALQEWRLMQLKKFGCNAYRASHNPMTPETLDACDRLGILVIEENRLTGINREHTDLLERMITRDRNHPCIILWSAGNEEWGLEWNEFGTRIAESMREYCHRFDPTRLMTIASSGGPAPLIPADVAGYNYILQNPVEQHRADWPERCAVGSEETSGCGTRGIYYDDHQKGRMVAHNRRKNGPDSLYNCIERGWKFYDERPWLGGLFYWTGFDYRGEPNPMVFPATNSQFGILDYCGFPKDEAYYLRAWWTESPTIHILPHWNLSGHEGEKVSVWVYSNCDEVELTVNGRKAGRKAMPKNGHLEWETVYKPGDIKATGYINGKKAAEEHLWTTGEAVSAAVKCERIKDIVIADISMLDRKGRLVPDSCEEVTVTLWDEWSGLGWQILGWGNGDPAFQAIERPVTYKAGANSDNGTPVPDPEARTMTVSTFNGRARILLQNRGCHCTDSADTDGIITVRLQ